ncbi:MAG: sigma-54-dependent Fis family transcriptional regulator [Gemmatimonadota bacterium]|nr:sigma-54-dependent Fis family transcriptional regulator [Gemmatimonadota bacterium]MDE3173554.1 sigma-54-dependent Fis family transcriptional regulator [Gemmatimonadota bacterium]MDE3214887.1 sigma-54-dependent Fis family transcriptional regulator [Gemmatimonadota bacterium]
MTASAAARILVADDDRDVLEALRLLLRGEGYELETAASPHAVVSAVGAQDFDAVLMDMNYTRDTTGGVEGLDLLARLQAVDATLPVVVMTAWGSIEGAVAALHRGARDYIEKPWNNARLLHVLATQVELGRAIRRGQRLESENRALRPEGAPQLIAQSAAMQPVLRLMERIGPSDASALITGEHGTGKEVVAHWLHAASPRRGRPMVTVNLGGLSEGVFESEMFGHVKGSFTDARADRVGRFELADGGTLFLDEVANVSPAMQAKLLRVLQTGEFERVGSSRTRRVDVRILAATNADLRGEVAAGRFREDLFFRLNTVELHLPPLRERRDDIGLLATHFLQRFAAHYRRPVTGFAPEAMAALLRYGWPGNVRELAHAVERATLLAQGELMLVTDFALQPAGGGAAPLEDMSLEDVERVLIQKAMARHDGNVSLAARALGLSRSALYRRLQRHAL